jgi:hypothetical protein
MQLTVFVGSAMHASIGGASIGQSALNEAHAERHAGVSVVAHIAAAIRSQ